MQLCGIIYSMAFEAYAAAGDDYDPPLTPRGAGIRVQRGRKELKLSVREANKVGPVVWYLGWGLGIAGAAGVFGVAYM